MRFGFHISIADGFLEVVPRARETGCETLQIFTASQLRWKRPVLDLEETQAFRAALKEAGLYPLVVHLFYLPNLASPDKELLGRSRNALIAELKRAAALGACYLVLHPGAYKESSLKKGLRSVANSLDYAIAKAAADAGDKVKILLENTAGGGTRLGGEFQELAEIFDVVKQSYRVGVCLDTAHAFQAGYPIHSGEGLEQTLEEFDRLIGLDRLLLLHLNDSKSPMGSRNDRHWHIGEGEMGLEAFRRIVNHPRLHHLAAIMETPTAPESDRRNMETAKALREEE